MSDPAIHMHQSGNAAILRIDNERKWNALTPDMLAQLEACCRTLEQQIGRSETRAVIVTGTGDRAFCCGADINAWSVLEPLDFARNWVREGHRIFDRLSQLSLPVIAALNGHAFGGGLELATACDIRIMHPGARLALPEAGVGVVPGWSGTQRLSGQMPAAIVKEMALFGRQIDARRATEIGFSNAVSDDPLGAALEWVDAMAGTSPVSVEIGKAMILAAGNESTGAVIEALGGGMIAGSKDKQEGVTAFRDKRKPVFSGN